MIFGARAIEIEGHNLGVLVDEIREGQLNGIRELVSGQSDAAGTRQSRQSADYRERQVVSGFRRHPEGNQRRGR